MTTSFTEAYDDLRKLGYEPLGILSGRDIKSGKDIESAVIETVACIREKVTKIYDEVQNGSYRSNIIDIKG